MLSYVQLSLLVLLTVYCVNGERRIHITRGKQDEFTNLKYLGQIGGSPDDCKEMHGDCIGMYCERCRCIGNDRTFVESRGKFGECIENKYLIFVTSNSLSFMVEEITTGKCLRVGQYDEYIRSESCHKATQWIWTNNDQLLNTDTLQCLSEKTSHTHTYNYLILDKCTSANAVWQCTNYPQLQILFKSRGTGNYMLTGHRSSYVESYNQISKAKKWRRLHTQRTLCSEALGCKRYADNRAMLVLDESSCTDPCEGKIQISKSTKWLEECFIEQTQYLNQNIWENIARNSDIFNISIEQGTAFLEWDFNQALKEGQWSGMVLKLQLSCQLKDPREQTIEEQSCILIKFVGNSSASPCISRPCHNNGSCSTGAGNHFKCLCPNGYNGETCQIKDLPSNIQKLLQVEITQRH